MADIEQLFPIAADPESVFAGIATPAGLDAWWTLTSSGNAAVGAKWTLGFGPEHSWKARVTRCEPPRAFELELTAAQEDWLGTRVAFVLEPTEGRTLVRFAHRGWPDRNDHYLTSCHCWALYLRILRRHVEHGETVAYPDRLQV